MADIATVEEREIREKRAKVFKRMSDIMEKLPTGGLTAEDRGEYDKLDRKLRDLDGDLARITDYNKLATVRSDIADARADTRGAAPITGDATAERIYENAFIRFMQDGHTDGMTDEERMVFRTFSTPQYIRRPAASKRYDQYIDTHGVKRDVGYDNLRVADIKWDESRAAADSNSLSTAPNSAGIAAGATGYDAGYMVPQGSNLR